MTIRIWNEKAKSLSDDQSDIKLAETGNWVFDTLQTIHKEVKASEIWDIRFDHFAQYNIGLNNYNFVFATNQSIDVTNKMGAVIPQFLNELVHQNIDQELFGPQNISSLIESSVDTLELALNFHNNKQEKNYRSSRKLLTKFIGIQNYAAMYLTTRNMFYKSLYFKWHIEDKNNAWFFVPNDIEDEFRWKASFTRFWSLRSEFAMHSISLWKNQLSLRNIWYNQTKGIPKFEIKMSSNNIWVKYLGKNKNIPDVPPKGFLNEVFAREFYYEPLLQEMLPKLDGLNVLDLLKIQFTLGIVAEHIIDKFPSLDKTKTFDYVKKFSLIILEEQLINSIALATGFDEKKVSVVINSLKWRKNHSLWFHPLVPISTNKGKGILFAITPLLSSNIYRCVDYWLTKFGLPMAKRGQLFEQEIFEELQLAINEANLTEKVFVLSSKKWLSSDKTSAEEIDILILMDNLIIVGEAKCQTFPATPLERFNYLNRLSDAAIQVERKVKWIKKNLDVIADGFKIDYNHLSGKVVPIIISNHGLGIGYKFDNIPVLDLLTISKYFSKPYQSSGIFTPDGKIIEHKQENFYNSFKEMVLFFEQYVNSPPALNFYLKSLKPNLIPLLIRQDKEVLTIDFEMDTNLLTQSN